MPVARGQSTSLDPGTSRGGALDLGALGPSQALAEAARARQLQERNTTLLGSGAVDPDSYLLGPGDFLRLEVRGALSLTAPALVGADGSVTFPQIGTVAVSGLTLTAARAEVRDRARRILPGGEVALVLDTMRAFKVHLVGEVLQPGAVAATASTRVSEVLSAAGGLGDSTSLRRIRVRHTDGSEEAADLLAFLLAGDLAGNPTLRDGDVLVVPPRADLIAFEGAVLYPGAYDFVPGDELGGLLATIGLRPDADRSRVLLQRTTDDRSYDTLAVALGPVLSGEISVLLRPGDRVLVRALGDWRLGASAVISGAVGSPGPVPVERGRTRVGDVVRAAGGFSAGAVPERIVLARAVLPDTSSLSLKHPMEAHNYATALAGRRQREVVVDLSQGDGPLVEAGDAIRVPRRSAWVELIGQVQRPGFYDHHEEWSARDYIDAAGGYGRQAEKSQTRVTRGASGDVVFASDLGPLAPGDMIWVPEKPPGSLWQTVRDVTGITSTLVTIYLLVREASR